MKRGFVCLVALTLVYSAPAVSADNTQDYYYPDFNTYPSTIIPDYVVISPETGDSETRFVCGYSLDRTVRSNGCSGTSEQEAPGEIWFRYDLPDGSLGNHIEIKVENLDEPHKVDLSLTLCSMRSSEPSTIECVPEPEELYGDSETSFLFYPLVSDVYWIQVLAWDEEKEGRSPGGDLTSIRVGLTENVSSNGDRVEPEFIPSGDTWRFDRKVCGIGCIEGAGEDPTDIFVIDGFKGDTVEVHFGSRENDIWSDKGLKVEVNHEIDFYDATRQSMFFLIDDQFHYDNYRGSGDRGVSKLIYEFDASGHLFIVFKALYSNSESESYTIEVIDYNTTQRDLTADRDGDGLPDYEEYLCGTDFRDPSDTSSDNDGDGICDDNDFDDDGDGIPDAYDSFPLDGLEWYDTDADGIGNNADLNDDGDAWTDVEETACGSDSLDSEYVPADYDGDMICDLLDMDDDNDGFPDDIDALPYDATENLDSDGDGMGDNYDHDDDGDMWFDDWELGCGTDPLDPDSVPDDNDGDYYCDLEDDDDDNDGMLDVYDLFPLNELEAFDFDGDGIGDNADIDDDGDGWTDTEEGDCSSDAYSWYSVPLDTDFDGVCDELDTDDDDDGVEDDLDVWPKDNKKTLDRDGDLVSLEEEGSVLDRIPTKATQMIFLAILVLSLLGGAILLTSFSNRARMGD